MMEIMIGDRVGGGRRVVDTSNRALVLTRQSQVDGTSVPASVRRPVYTQDARDVYRRQHYRPGPTLDLPSIPRPGYDGIYHGRPLPILPGRLTFPCSYARRFPPGHHLPPPSLHVDMNMVGQPTPPMPSRHFYDERLVPMDKLKALRRVDKLRREKSRELVPMDKCKALRRVDKLRREKARELVPMDKCKALRRAIKLRKEKARDLVPMNKCKVLRKVDKLRRDKALELVPMDKRKALRRVDKLRRAKARELVPMDKRKALRRVIKLRKEKGQEFVPMHKAVDLKSVEKLGKRKKELIRQGNIPERTCSNIYDFINKKMCDMFVVILNNIRQDIIELNKILQYKIGVKDERDHVVVQNTEVVLNLHRYNANRERLERLIRSANNSDHTYVQEDWRKINEKQKHRIGIIKVIKLKMRRLKKLCINGCIRYNDDTQVIINLIRSLNDNYKSIKVVRDVFIQQCIDNDLELIKQLEKDIHECTEEPLDHETLAKIQKVVSRISVKTNAENAMSTGSSIARKTDDKVSYTASDAGRKLCKRAVNIGKH